MSKPELVKINLEKARKPVLDLLNSISRCPSLNSNFKQRLLDHFPWSIQDLGALKSKLKPATQYDDERKAINLMIRLFNSTSEFTFESSCPTGQVEIGK